MSFGLSHHLDLFKKTECTLHISLEPLFISDDFILFSSFTICLGYFSSTSGFLPRDQFDIVLNKYVESTVINSVTMDEMDRESSNGYFKLKDVIMPRSVKNKGGISGNFRRIDDLIYRSRADEPGAFSLHFCTTCRISCRCSCIIVYFVYDSLDRRYNCL